MPFVRPVTSYPAVLYLSFSVLSIRTVPSFSFSGYPSSFIKSFVPAHVERTTPSTIESSGSPHAIVTFALPLTIDGSTVALGAIVEVAQEAMGIGRSGDWIDFVADTAGGVLGCVSAIMINKKWFKY